MLKKFWLTLSAIALASTACSDSSKREWHVDPIAGQGADPTGELARLHQMEKIRVFLPEGGADGKGAYEDWDITQLRQTVVDLCQLRHVVSIASPSSYTCGDTVARGGSDIAAETCSAETMNEIAHAAVAPIELKHVAATWHYVIPPQSEPARLAMLRDVRYFATRAAYRGQRMLQGIALLSRYNPTGNAGFLPAPCPQGTWGSTYKTSNSIPKFYPDAWTTGARLRKSWPPPSPPASASSETLHSRRRKRRLAWPNGTAVPPSRWCWRNSDLFLDLRYRAQQPPICSWVGRKGYSLARYQTVRAKFLEATPSARRRL
jgi:hypothetical protein